MKKVAALLASIMFLAIGTPLSAPIILKNNISPEENAIDTAFSGESIGRLIEHGSGHDDYLGTYGDFTGWSRTFTFNPSGDFQTICNPVASVPEPSTMILLGIGILAIGLVARKIKRKSDQLIKE
jgi:hypothetical protein